MFDARYEKVRHDGQLRDCAVLIALGIGPEGQRSILGVSVALSEAEVRAFFQSLVQRGLCGVEFIVSDDHCGGGGHRAQGRLWGVPWQRCQFHLQQNAQAYVPRLDQRAEVARAIRSVFDRPSRPAAQVRRKKSSPATPGRTQTRPVAGGKPPEGLTGRRSNAAPAWPVSFPMNNPSCA